MLSCYARYEKRESARPASNQTLRWLVSMFFIFIYLVLYPLEGDALRQMSKHVASLAGCTEGSNPTQRR